MVDSVAALTPRAEIEGEMGDHHVGLQARLMSQALRKLTGTVSKSNATVIFINQIRMKIGVMFGNPETTTGGNALKFYSSVRLDVRRIAALKDGDEVVGNRTRVKVVKNKVAPPFRQAEFDILYNQGISLEGDLLDLGVEAGVVEKSGAWYSYDDERIGQGRENARKFMLENIRTSASASGRSRLRPPRPQARGTRDRGRRGHGGGRSGELADHLDLAFGALAQLSHHCAGRRGSLLELCNRARRGLGGHGEEQSARGLGVGQEETLHLVDACREARTGRHIGEVRRASAGHHPLFDEAPGKVEARNRAGLDASGES